MSDTSHTIGQGYPVGQLLRALDSLAHHDDPAVRARVQARADRWRAVLAGMQTGAVSPGSRTPVADTPAWATLEVVTGGFATGRLLAEQPLDDVEQAQLAELPPARPGDSDRGRLNRHALGEAGQRGLLALLRSGAYRIDLPEHGALLAVAWLTAQGQADAALDIVEAIAPFFDRLRFTPRPAARPQPGGATVHRLPARDVAEHLRSRPPNARVAAMNQALSVWNPLTDQALALLLETVDGPVPHLVADPDGGHQRRPDGQPVVQGGWPLAHTPADWPLRARLWSVAVASAESAGAPSSRPANRRSSLARMRAAIAAALGDRPPLSPRERAALRAVLAGCIARRGMPDSARLASLRQHQARTAARPMHHVLARVLAERLAHLPPDAGLPALDAVAGPVTPQESAQAAGAAMPAPLIRRLHQCLDAPVDQLVALGAIPSAEVLAQVLPQLSAQVVAAGIRDPDLRGLFTQVYAAFRRRRGLLLVDLQHQVRIEELPWIGALEAFRDRDLAAAEVARQSLRQVSILALSSFPQTILPNPLITELHALAKAAGLSVPLVEELAADIFMGAFTPKFTQAAQVAATVLHGSLYARYYDLPTVDELTGVQAPDRVRRSIAALGLSRKGGADTDQLFAMRCRTRAREAGVSKQGFSVAANGAILEQAQILHTHNLAPLFAALELSTPMAALLPDMARDCFTWVLARQRPVLHHWQQELQHLKNCAYAWRQMIFFLSVAPPDTVATFLPWAWQQLEASSANPRVARFRPVLVGLHAVARGGRFDSDGRLVDAQGRPGRRLLGWSVGPHWLAPSTHPGGARA